jgi:hypothetical protein
VLTPGVSIVLVPLKWHGPYPPGTGLQDGGLTPYQLVDAER